MATRYPNRTGSRRETARAPDRPPELTDWLNKRAFHPLARYLAAALFPTGISANAVSVAGALVVAAAGFLYIGLDWPLSVLLGFGAHLLWHVLDGADGELARMRGSASPAGELIDGACDYLSHIFLYTLLAWFLSFSIGHWAWPVTLAAGISRVLQANHAESRRLTDLWRVYGVEWIGRARTAERNIFERRGLFQRLFGGLGQAYVALSEWVSPPSPPIDDAVERAGPGRAGERVRRLCRRAGRTSLRLQSWLGANPRTILLGSSMAAGSPIWFFLVEILPLNLLLIWSVRHQSVCDRSLERKLSGLSLRSAPRSGR